MQRTIINLMGMGFFFLPGYIIIFQINNTVVLHLLAFKLRSKQPLQRTEAKLNAFFLKSARCSYFVLGL